MLFRDRYYGMRQGLKLLPTETIGGGLTPGGNVYYAMHSNHAEYERFKAEHDVTYPDGSTSVQTSVQAAVDACEDDRGDVIWVMPTSSTTGKWKENVYANKTGIKIFSAVYGWENQFRPGDATTKYTMSGNVSVSGFSFLLLDRSIELAGFLFDGGGGYGGVYIGDGYNTSGSATYGSNQNSANCWVHDCIFRGGNEGTYGLVLDGCSANVLIEDNIFEEWDNAGIYITPGGSRTVQRPVIRRNEFVVSDGTDYGIDFYAASTTVGTLIRDNSFRDTANQFAAAVRIPAGATGVTSLCGNFFACTNMMDVLATDIHSGNYRSTLNASEVYVDVD